MGIEIERKFLVEGVPPELQGVEGELIVQGYLVVGADGTEVRVRRRDERCYLTVKSPGTVARVEEEIEIDERRFSSLWQLTADRHLRKRRWRLPLGEGLTAEIDVYEDGLAGLVTAEVEFVSEDAAHRFQPPRWFGEDVTADPRYRNQSLALRSGTAGGEARHS